MNPFVEARNAGLSPIPVRKGSKVPAISWKDFQVEICSELQAVEWGNGGGYSIGLVTGEVSGRLMAVDIEAWFVPRLGELAQRMRAAGVYEVWKSWLGGYHESTPRGGLHVLVRLEGEGACPRNEVFASDLDGKVLVETRGEGGYVLVAPTVGYVVGSGGFSSIVYCTWDEWCRIEAVLRTFDTQIAAPAPTVVTRSTVTLDPILGDGGFAAEIASLGDIRSVLAEHGWTPTGRSDEYGEHWTRPGKDPREGSSGSISAKNRLYVHSSNVGMHVGNPTYDVLDVTLFYDLGRDPDIEDRRNWFRVRGQRPTAAERSGVGAAPREGEVAAPNLSPDLCIEDWFWEARPLFTQLRDSSMERGLSPDGVCGAWLSGYAATIPMGIWVAGPPRRAPLNMYSVLVGSSGTGKTGSMGVASELLGWNVNQNPHVLLERGLRSGEGLCRLAQIERKKSELDDGGPAYRNAVQLAFDEGGVLSKQTERQGSSTIPYLNTAWSGSGVVGGALAREIFEFPANLVRVCAVIGVQYGAAGNLFEGEAARLGFPQRLLYFGLSHPHLRDSDVTRQSSDPATALDLPWWEHANYSGRPHYLHFPDHIEHQVRLWTQNKDHGDGIDDPLDAHQMNLTKRVAAILSLADRRDTPNNQDWDLASHLVDTSRKIRRTLYASLQGIRTEHRQTRINEAIQLQDALEDHQLPRLATRIARYIHNNKNGNTRKDLKNRLNPTERLRLDEIITHALRMDWITTSEKRYYPGPSQPA